MNDRIKEIRKHLKMTQTEFAKETGKTRDSISNLELGRVAPDETFMELVCRKFGISELWLRTGEGEMFSATAEEDAITAVLSSAIGHADTEQQRFIRAVAKIPPEYIPAVTQAALAYIKAMYPRSPQRPPPGQPLCRKIKSDPCRFKNQQGPFLHINYFPVMRSSFSYVPCAVKSSSETGDSFSVFFSWAILFFSAAFSRFSFSLSDSVTNHRFPILISTSLYSRSSPR